MELSEKELEDVLGGTQLGYEEAKKRSKFKPAFRKEEKKRVDAEIGELSEEDLEKYLGGIRIEDEEYDMKR